VQATLSDKKLGILQDESSTFAGYEADLLSAVDYYPFGMQMPERSVRSDSYRFGMNTQEKDDEIYGQGNTYSAEFWEYDARLARRWNVDPEDEPSLSSYHVFEGNPIALIDPLGNSAGWFEGKNGVEFDKKINTQEELDKSGKGKENGKYIGKTGIAFDGNGQQFFLSEDGKKIKGGVPIKAVNIVAQKVENVNETVSEINKSNNLTISNSYDINNSAPWMTFAFQEYNKNVKEIPDNSNSGPHINDYLKSAGINSPSKWCASYVHWSFYKSGKKGAGASGENWKTWGTKLVEPKYGAVVIIKHTTHIGFFVKINTNGTITILHGNWGNKISLSKDFAKSRIQEYRFPK
jgi:uncharacterized protein (TIGR02594 family)